MGIRMVDGKIVTDGDMPLGEAMTEVDSDAPFTATSIDTDSTDPLCEVCGEPIVYSGRGRRPKYHPEHRPQAPKRDGSPVRNGTLRNEAALRAALLERYMQLGMLASFAHPAYGNGIKQKAQQAVDADIEYARVSPAFRRTLESLIEKSALGVVIAVHASMLAPIVIGERAKAARKGAAAQAARQAQAGGTQPRSNTAPPRPPQPTATAPMPPMPNVYDLYPSQESDVPAETVNAAAMPGMPG